MERVRERRSGSVAVDVRICVARPVDLARGVGVFEVCVSDHTPLGTWF